MAGLNNVEFDSHLWYHLLHKVQGIDHSCILYQYLCTQPQGSKGYQHKISTDIPV
jgi:hypothetical protein